MPGTATKTRKYYFDDGAELLHSSFKQLRGWKPHHQVPTLYVAAIPI
jgi:hypothetical protein